MVAQLFSLLVLAAVPDFTADPAARAFLWRMVAEARYGFSETEEAAFVVRDADGGISFVRWPRAGMKNQARWPGAFPPGTIAIVHTHPNRIPDPSQLDERAARRKSIPIYVLTRTKITRTTGGAAEVVLEGDWSPRATLASAAR